MKRLLLTGAHGQLGRAVQRLADGRVSLHAVGRDRLDLRDAAAVHKAIAELRPDAVINAAAYTAVDAAESDDATARAVNTDAPGHLATACAAVDAHFLHVSTDFVFDGSARTPYAPDAPTQPLGVYGQSKRDGERAALAEAPAHTTIVRTAWVYGPGGRNFVRTMLRLLGERAQLNVVSDQIGAPTHTFGLAEVLLRIAERGVARGDTLHWTDAGVASWYDLAEAVRLLAQRRWPQRTWGRVNPITTADYPTPARRPAYSVLDCRATTALLELDAVSWQARLEAALLHDPARDWLPPEA